MFEIRKPRYHDSRVLLATWKLEDGENEIVFTEDSSRSGRVYVVNSEDVKTCPIDYISAKKIPVYAVPLEMLKLKKEPVKG